MFARSWVLALAIVALAGCKKEEAVPAPPPAPAPAAAPAPAPKPAKVEAAVTSVSGQSDGDCVGPIDLAVPQEVAIGVRKAQRNGYKLSFPAPAEKKDAAVVFGVLGDLNEDSGENLVNLKKYVEFFKAESAPGIQRALTPLAETGLPLFVVIGNRECRGDFNDAVTALQKTFSNVVNLDMVRHVEFGGVDLVSLPGYHDKRYLHCPSGCQYFKQDLEALKPIAKGAKNPVVFVAHGPPHGGTPQALDTATEVGNVGDANLNSFLLAAGINLGVNANIKEAGARATDLDGANVIKQDVFAEKLFLNPGPADAVAWAMNDGTQSMGMVATLTVQGAKAKYKIFRAKPLTAEEKAQAAKLAPAAPDDKPEPAKNEPAKKEEAPKK